MASGAKLPNTNLNLIQDTDMIDHADINAIAQAVEANIEPIEAVLTAGKFDAARFKLYRIGRLCVTVGYIYFTEAIPPGGNHIIGAVPVGFRPPVNVQTWPVSNTTKESVALMFFPDGTIALYNYSSTPLGIKSALTANLTWITNA